MPWPVRGTRWPLGELAALRWVVLSVLYGSAWLLCALRPALSPDLSPPCAPKATHELSQGLLTGFGSDHWDKSETGPSRCL